MVKSLGINEVHRLTTPVLYHMIDSSILCKVPADESHLSMPLSVPHVFSLSVVTHLSWFHSKLTWISVSSSSLRRSSPVVVSRRPVTEAKFLVKLGMDFLNKQPNSMGNICSPIKSHGKSLRITCIVFNWLSTLLQCPQLWATVLTERLLVLHKFVFWTYFFGRFN